MQHLVPYNFFLGRIFYLVHSNQCLSYLKDATEKKTLLTLKNGATDILNPECCWLS